jgi:hypothetical protein
MARRDGIWRATSIIPVDRMRIPSAAAAESSLLHRAVSSRGRRSPSTTDRNISTIFSRTIAVARRAARGNRVPPDASEPPAVPGRKGGWNKAMSACLVSGTCVLPALIVQRTCPPSARLFRNCARSISLRNCSVVRRCSRASFSARSPSRASIARSRLRCSFKASAGLPSP